MKQFRKILKFELKSYLSNKVFVGITLFLVAAIVVVMFFPRLLAAFKTDGEQTPEQSGTMLVVSDRQENSALVESVFRSTFPEYEIVMTEAGDEAIREKIASGDADCAVVLESLTRFRYYVENASMYDSTAYTAEEALRTLYRIGAMTESGMSTERAQEVLNAEIGFETVLLGKDQMQNFWYTYIMIFALYMVILLYGQMVATNVATEKSSRAMELLVTSANPVSMMFGKVIASCLMGLLQLVLIFGSAIVCFRLNASYWGGNEIVSSIFDMPPELLAYMLLFFMLGFFLYAFMYGAVGSTASKLEDINTSVMPITFLFLISFMVVMISMASGAVDNTLMLVCSFIPFTSPVAMFTRIAMSTVPGWQIAVSLAVLVASVAGIGVVSAKIYRVGVLLYGTPPKPAAILKAIRKA